MNDGNGSSECKPTPKLKLEDELVHSKAKRHQELSGSESHRTDKDSHDEKMMKLRPNYFLGFQIFNPIIHQRVRDMQCKIIEKEPSLYPALIKIATLHITLAVTHLANQNEIEVVAQKLNEWAKLNSDRFINKPITLTFDGVNSFQNQVLYVEMNKCENYQRTCQLADEMKEVLCSAGFSSDEKPFTPHLTILKLSKNRKLFKSKNRFKEIFKSLKESSPYFGTQDVCQIQFLEMAQKDSNGYYKSCGEVKIGPPLQLGDHTNCCQKIIWPKNLLNMGHPKSENQRSFYTEASRECSGEEEKNSTADEPFLTLDAKTNFDLNIIDHVKDTNLVKSEIQNSICTEASSIAVCTGENNSIEEEQPATSADPKAKYDDVLKCCILSSFAIFIVVFAIKKLIK